MADDDFDLEVIAAEMATRIKTNIALFGGDNGRAFGYMRDSPAVPEVGIAPAPGEFLDYDPVLSSNAADILMLATVVLGAAQDRSSQKVAMSLLKPTGATSIRAALNGSNYASCDYVRVERALNYGLIPWPSGTFYMGFQLLIRVATS